MSEQASRADVLLLRAQSRRSARAAGLRYVDDSHPGLRRVRRGKSFSYSDAQGHPIRDPATLARIRKLAVPPAWTEVWICPHDNGHIQATGRDARGRKQYRYHAQWSLVREADKHRRICEFARLMPRVRAHCARQLRKQGLGRETVLSALLRIIDLTGIRVGHEEYTRANSSYGLTTLRPRHAKVRGRDVELRFRGKSGVTRCLRFRDARLARLVAASRALRARHLFNYVDQRGRPRAVHADLLNAYLRGLTAPRYSVKDFRTWSATVSVALDLRERGPAASQRQSKRAVLEAVRKAAEYLGNTPAVCRKSYVHPGLFEAYFEGLVLPPDPPRAGASALARERAVLAFLEARQPDVTKIKLKRAG